MRQIKTWFRCRHATRDGMPEAKDRRRANFFARIAQSGVASPPMTG